MKLSLPLLAALATACVVPSLHAGDMGRSSTGHYRTHGCASCADSKFQTPRYHQLPIYRHNEDRKRYNAAACCGEPVRVHPYLVKTVVVSKKRVPHYTYDAYGNRRCRKAVTTIYKDLYSDGSCYVWTQHG